VPGHAHQESRSVKMPTTWVWPRDAHEPASRRYEIVMENDLIEG
jgi:hypothetical protein